MDKPAIDSQTGFLPEPVGNQAPQEPKTDLLTFVEVNEVTWKITDGIGINAWDGNRGGYRTSRAVAWLMGVGNGQWIVRYRNKASKPMRLSKAKKYALEMVRGIRPGIVLSDPIRSLNLLAAKLADQGDRQRWPVNVMGGNRSRSHTVGSATVAEILLAECPMLVDVKVAPEAQPPLQGDGYWLDSDDLPACLDRR